MENIWCGFICCSRCTNCSASSRVSNIIRLYNRPARTWSHLHIVSVIAFPPSNRLSSRFSSQSNSAYLSCPSLLFTSNTFPGDKSHSTRQCTQSNLIKMRGTRSGTPLIFNTSTKPLRITLTSFHPRRHTLHQSHLRPSSALPAHRLLPSRHLPLPKPQSPCTSPRRACGSQSLDALWQNSAHSHRVFQPVSTSHLPRHSRLRSCPTRQPCRRRPSTSSRRCTPANRADCAPQPPRAAPCPLRREPHPPSPSAQPLPCSGPTNW